ncbi:hypothetical protein [Facklamia miroungae]|uniref:Uncharacterized protein n=1 Tax=Facklamia miroungae TaxID=120956 RepID=A0A1G7P079_9LACT|nr:hypothetical protein [Facklamia miroungae]NKZ28534.1 hypothetical protein [Facklamia miroungae]SDF79641.1 hypothetical protein SAMN05421791_10175 [Facklamia miroungae]
MQMTVSSQIKLDRIIKAMEDREHPVFAIDLNKDEINNFDSFFIYNDKGNIFRAEGANQYRMNFTVLYISKTHDDIDEITLIDELIRYGLTFVDSSREEAKFKETDQTALVITLNFTQIFRLCR